MAIHQLNTVEELRFAIQQLEIKQANEWTPLKEQLLTTAETLKPRHIIKDILRKNFTGPTLKANAVGSTLGLAAALSVYFIFPTVAIKLTKLVSGVILGASALERIVNHGSQIKSVGFSLLKRLTNRQPTL
jgi:hypothetical protein